MSTTPVALLDVNVLLAAAWPDHQFHRAAQAWMGAHPDLQWASCAITQAGFVRLSCKASLMPQAATPAQAIALLGRIVRYAGHHYWAECPAIGDLALWPSLLIHGQRQITDAYLLALAHHHRGKLVTLDRGIPELLPKPSDRRRWVEVIPP